jgi:DNA-binding HxlR family transcriptional regulator
VINLLLKTGWLISQSYAVLFRWLRASLCFSDRTEGGSSNLKAEHKHILERGDAVSSSLVIESIAIPCEGDKYAQKCAILTSMIVSRGTPIPERKRWAMQQEISVTRDKCGVETTIAVVGGKWKPMIVYALLSGPRRFGELTWLIPEITQRMLTLQLRELEEDGVIAREVYKQVPPKVEYSLTPLGQTIEPILSLMQRWGEHYANTRATSEEHSRDQGRNEL